MKNFIAFILMLLAVSTEKCFAQDQHKIDSLKSVLQSSKEDTNRVNTLLELSSALSKIDKEQSLDFATQAFKLSNKINYQKGIGSSYIHLGYLKFQDQEFDDAEKYFVKGIEMCRMTNNKIGQAQALGKLGVIRYNHGNYAEAIKYYVEALQLCHELGKKDWMGNNILNIGLCNYNLCKYSESTKNYEQALILRQEALADALRNKDYKKAKTQNQDIADLNMDIANNYNTQGNYTKALNIYLKVLQFYDKDTSDDINSKKGMINCYFNIGIVYEGQGEYNEALKNFNKSLKIVKEINHKTHFANTYAEMSRVTHKLSEDNSFSNDKHKSDSLQNLSLSYAYESLKYAKELHDSDYIGWSNCYIGNYLYDHRKYAECINNYLTAFDLFKKNDDKLGLVESSIYLGSTYLNLKNFAKAKSSLKTALKISTEIGTKDDIRDAYYDLSILNDSIKDYKKAHEYYKSFITYKDSLFNEKDVKKITQLQMQYDFDKKQLSQKAEQEKKDAIAIAHLKSQTTIRNYSLAALALAIIVGLLLFNQFRSSQKSKQLLEEKNKIIEREKQRAEESEKFKSRFLANMSHEIRTPMNAVMGMTNLVLNSKLDSQQHKYLDAVQKSSRNLLVIINDILDLSKIEAGKMELEKIDFRLYDTIDTVYNTLRFRAEEKGLKFNVTIDENVPAVLKGDAVRLNQVLINLLGNAIKFTPKGKVELNITNKVETQSPISNLQFSISDTGIGIPQDKISKVFEGFQQADKETFRKFGGTGLGLNISKQLIEMMGGTIVAESEQGKGTTFTLAIPFSIGSENSLNIVPQKIDESLLKTLSKLHILLAEDNEFNQIVAKDTLQMIIPGITVDIANNGEEAVAKIKTKNYDLILMDINMPEMNGLEAARIIRQMPPPLNNIYIIAMTASVTKDEIASCFDAGMNDYVPKPFEQNELIEKIAKVKAEL